MNISPEAQGELIEDYAHLKDYEIVRWYSDLAITGWAYKNGGWPLFGYKPHRVCIGGNRRYEEIHKLVWVLDDRVFGGRQVWEWAKTMLLQWRLRDRLGYDAIAGELTEAGVPTPSGNPAWSPSSIQEVLAEWDRLYQHSGIAFWNRRDYRRNKRNPRLRDTAEWIVVPNAHPAIITEAETARTIMPAALIAVAGGAGCVHVGTFVEKSWRVRSLAKSWDA